MTLEQKSKLEILEIKIVYYAPRGRKGTSLTSAENTLVDKVPLPRGAYAIFYNTCVISDVF